MVNTVLAMLYLATIVLFIFQSPKELNHDRLAFFISFGIVVIVLASLSLIKRPCGHGSILRGLSGLYFPFV